SKGTDPKATHGAPNVAFNLGPDANAPPPALQQGPGKKATPVLEFIKGAQSKAGDGYTGRMGQAQKGFEQLPAGLSKDDVYLRNAQEARDRWANYNYANAALRQGQKAVVQEGKLGVELSCDNGNLRCQERLTNTATRWIGTRNCVEIGGVWIDEKYEAKMPTVTVKAMSDAYFAILERHPEVRDVFRISNHMVWVTPSGTALVLDAENGVETMTDAAIDRLFTAAAKK